MEIGLNVQGKLNAFICLKICQPIRGVGKMPLECSVGKGGVKSITALLKYKKPVH